MHNRSIMHRHIHLSISLLIGIVVLLVGALAKRNAKEEAICHPFLTSKKTSPLLELPQRDLKVDDDGDFACRLVLQDETLPAQIRVTINEGLFWLAVRHVQMGLMEHHIAAAQARILALMLPEIHYFHVLAANWEMDDKVREYAHAAQHFHNALYGSAKPVADSKSDQKQQSSSVELYKSRRSYARVLGYLSRFAEAAEEYIQILEENPYDFGASFSLKQCIEKLKHAPSTPDAEGTLQLNAESILKMEMVLHKSSQSYGMIAREAKNLYAGYSTPTNELEILEFNGIDNFPSKDKIDELIANRRPFVVRNATSKINKIDDSNNNNNLFSHWRVSEWQSSSYLLQKVGKNTEVAVEVKDSSSEGASVFGFGVDVGKKKVTFGELIENIDQDDDELSRGGGGGGGGKYIYYMNTQAKDCGLGVYRCPLDRLRDDFPVDHNDSTMSLFSDIFNNITEISLWIGNSRKEWTHSRLHMDATDNFYFMVQGMKKFLLFPPTFATKMNTVSPVIAVLPNGLSFTFNPTKFYESGNTKPSEYDSSATALLDGVPELKLSTIHGLEHYTSNYHFSEYFIPLDENSNYQMTPEVAAMNPYIVDIHPGDMLYLPTGWYHQVSSKRGRHTAMNFWWKPPNWQDAVRLEKEISSSVNREVLRRVQQKGLFMKEL